MLQFRGLRLARDGELSRRVTVFALPRQSSPGPRHPKMRRFRRKGIPQWIATSNNSAPTGRRRSQASRRWALARKV